MERPRSAHVLQQCRRLVTQIGVDLARVAFLNKIMCIPFHSRPVIFKTQQLPVKPFDSLMFSASSSVYFLHDLIVPSTKNAKYGALQSSTSEMVKDSSAPIQADYWFQTASSIVHLLQPPSCFNYSYASSQNTSWKTPVELPKDNHI
ncbi:unnamed protein product, partial [Prunus brigantina]